MVEFSRKIDLTDFLGREGVRVIEFVIDDVTYHLIACKSDEYPNAIMLHSSLRQEAPKKYAEMLVREIESEMKRRDKKV